MVKKYNKKKAMPICLIGWCLVRLQLIMVMMLLMTLRAAKSAPLFHLLLCLMSVVKFGGASVKALASGIYFR
jgi:hypothetical protein